MGPGGIGFQMTDEQDKSEFEKNAQEKPTKNSYKSQCICVMAFFVAGSAGACLHKQMQHNSSDQLDYLRLILIAGNLINII